MARSFKEHEADQDLWESLNFAIVDAEEVLVDLERRLPSTGDVAATAQVIRLQLVRTRMAVAEWAGQKGFSKHQLPELQLLAKGGVERLLLEHREHRGSPLSRSESEAI